MDFCARKKRKRSGYTKEWTMCLKLTDCEGVKKSERNKALLCDIFDFVPSLCSLSGKRFPDLNLFCQCQYPINFCFICPSNATHREEQGEKPNRPPWGKCQRESRRRPTARSSAPIRPARRPAKRPCRGRAGFLRCCPMPRRTPRPPRCPSAIRADSCTPEGKFKHLIVVVLNFIGIDSDFIP